MTCKKLEKTTPSKNNNRIEIVAGEYSSGNKELVAEVIDNYLLSLSEIDSNGYTDAHSGNLRDYLNAEFPGFEWVKNSSQAPFDVYCIDARIAIENKCSKVRRNLDGKFGVHQHLIVNATLYPSEAKVKDVVPKKHHKSLTKEELESFMDVLVVVADKDRDTNAVVRHKIVDGAYWGNDYMTYTGCRDFFKQANDEVSLRILFETVADKFPGNVFVRRTIEGDLPTVKSHIRKLLSVKNPTADL